MATATDKASANLFLDPAQRALRAVEREAAQTKLEIAARNRPLVYETDKWLGLLYEDGRERDFDLRGVETQWASRFGAGPSFVREVFGRLYDPDLEKLPEEERAKGLEWAVKAHELADEVPEYGRFAGRCAGDSFAARLGAACVAEAALDALPAEAKQEDDPRDVEEDLDGLDGLGEAGIPVGKAKQAAGRLLAKAMSQGKAAAAKLDDGKMREAIRKGLAKAEEELSKAEAGLAGFGWDLSDPRNRNAGGAAEKAALANRIASNKKLQRIAAKAGRMRRIAGKVQREKVQHGVNEVAGVTQGRDLARMLPVEGLKLMATPVVWFRDFTEGKLQQYRLMGKRPAGKGPIVVCFDGSGSMDGEPEIWAKAVGLGLAEVARREKRGLAFVHFSTRVERVDIFPKGQADPVKLVEAMEFFPDGGTAFVPALAEAAGIIEKIGGFGKADIVFITDGCADAPDWTWWEKERARLGFGVQVVAINTEVTEVLRRLATEEVITVRDLSEGGADEKKVTNRLFSV